MEPCIPWLCACNELLHVVDISHKQPSKVTGCAGAFHGLVNVFESPNKVDSSTSISKSPLEASIAISSKFKPANGSAVSSANVCGLFCWNVHEAGVAQVETFSISSIKFRFAAKPDNVFAFAPLRAPLLLLESPCKTRFLSCLSPSTWPLVFVMFAFAMRGVTNWWRPSVCGVSGWMLVFMRGKRFWVSGGTEWLRLLFCTPAAALLSWLQSAANSCSVGKCSRKFCWVVWSGVDVMVAVVCWKRQSEVDVLLENSVKLPSKGHFLLAIFAVIFGAIFFFDRWKRENSYECCDVKLSLFEHP